MRRREHVFAVEPAAVGGEPQHALVHDAEPVDPSQAATGILAMAQKTADIERLQGELVQVRAEAIAKDSRIAFMAQDLETLQATIPQLEDKQRLQKRVDQMAQRQQELEAHNADLRRRLAMAERAATERAGMERSTPEVTALQEVQAVVVQLHQKVVLCVGGRSGNIANYRDVVERVGGKFAHHDGGVEDNASVLDANLAAADLVICQTGCISHNAYWRVKDFCKRTGKRCVFVENPSASSLERGLAQIAVSRPVAEVSVPELPR